MPLPAAITSLPDRLFLDLAIGTSSFDDICLTYGLDPGDVKLREEDSVFRKRLLEAKQAVEEDGTSFKARCRILAHDALPEVRRLIGDDSAPASAQIEAFKTLAKLGALEPTPTAPGAGGPGLSLTIVAPGGETISIHTAGAPPAPAQERPAIDVKPTEADELDDFSWVEA